MVGLDAETETEQDDVFLAEEPILRGGDRRQQHEHRRDARKQSSNRRGEKPRGAPLTNVAADDNPHGCAGCFFTSRSWFRSP